MKTMMMKTMMKTKRKTKSWRRDQAPAHWLKSVLARMREARKAQGLTQGDLLPLMFMGKSSQICRLEKGQAAVTLDILENWATATGASLRWLLFEEGPMWADDDITDDGRPPYSWNVQG
jgi:ribosome-binding protein aMBF1 (putative translation factor)